MLRLTRRTEYGLMALAFLAAQRDRYCCAREITSALGIPRRLMAEILKDLARSALVSAMRGPGGGYRLRLHPAEISVARVVRALEGPQRFTDCDNGGQCSLEPGCTIRGGIRRVSERLAQVLDSVTLEEIAAAARELGPAPGGARLPELAVR